MLVAKLDIAGVCACARRLNAWIPVIGKTSPARRGLYDNRGNAGDVFCGNIIFFYLSLSFSFGIKLLFLCSHLNIPGSGFV